MLAVDFVLDVIQLIKIASDDNPFKIMTLIGIVVSLIALVCAVWYMLAKYTKKAAALYKIFMVIEACLMVIAKYRDKTASGTK